MGYLETKSPYGKQHGRILGALNLLNSKYTQLIADNSWRKPRNESLRALLLEVERIFNSTPRTCEFIGDVNSYVPLSAMQLLTMKTKLVCHLQEFSRNFSEGRSILSKTMEPCLTFV